MPAAMTFTSLQALLQAYLERGGALDPTVAENLPTLINLAERALIRRFKIQGILTCVVSSAPNGGLQAGRSVYAKPDRWRLTASMSYGSAGVGAQFISTIDTSELSVDTSVTVDSPGVPDITTWNYRNILLPRSLEYCQKYWPDQTQTGAPKFYADYNYGNWLIAPTPDQNYPWAVNYYAQPPLLDNSNQTNWLTEFCPNLLLYRTLLEATPFLKNDERIPVWQDFYKEELAAVNQEDLQKAADRTAVRNQS